MTVNPSWQHAIQRGAKGLQTLVNEGLLSSDRAGELREVVERFGFFTTRHYLDLIDRNDPACPIRLQAIPDLRELDISRSERSDPIGDSPHEATPGVIHRYPDRALVFLTLQCPLLCRFCFRKVYLNEESPISFGSRLETALAYVAGHPEIQEVILSGGDPLLLNDRRAEETFKAFSSLPHVRSLRLHSRVLAALPSRITDSLLQVLQGEENVTLVNHINHPKEWTPEAQSAAKRLRKSGVRLFSQTVLMKGVNDSVDTLETLFNMLSVDGVTPYYLHHPDQTVGTQHFRISLERGIQIMKGLRGKISGYAIPEYVLDLPGGLGKIPVDSAFLERDSEPGHWRYESPFGVRGIYRDLGHVQNP